MFTQHSANQIFRFTQTGVKRGAEQYQTNEINGELKENFEPLYSEVCWVQE